MTVRLLEQAPALSAKRVLVRVDFNVPMQDGRITDDSRLRSALPTIRFLVERGATEVLLAHFGRPKGQRVPSMSLRPLVAPLSSLLEQPVRFAEDCIGAAAKAAIDGIKAGGEANDPAFARELAANCD